MEQDDDDDLMQRARRLQNLDLEPKVFGMEIKFSRTVQLLLLLAFAAAIAGVVLLVRKLRVEDTRNKKN
jgi:hypothetical protein